MKPKVIDYAPLELFSLDKTPTWGLTMAKGNKIVDKYFSNWQLGYGSLLGAVRNEDQYIHHDIDIDVDILLDIDEEESISKFDREMLDNGFTHLRKQFFTYKGKELTMSIAYKDSSNKVVYDVCIFRQFAQDFLHIGKEGMVIRPIWSFIRKELDVQGMKCYIPEEYDRYLTGRYGDWRTPKVTKGDWYMDAQVGNLFIPMDFGIDVIQGY